MYKKVTHKVIICNFRNPNHDMGGCLFVGFMSAYDTIGVNLTCIRCTPVPAKKNMLLENLQISWFLLFNEARDPLSKQSLKLVLFM